MAISSSGSSLKPLTFPEVEKDWRCYYDVDHDLPISCMLCEASFEIHNQSAKDGTAVRQLFLQHLFKEHKLVIHKVCDIASYRCYSRYWKVRFKETDINQLLPIVKTNPETSDPSESFYVLSSACSEDTQLRKFLQQKRLEAVLDVQQKEREDMNFHQACLFCSSTDFSASRSSLFHHMLTSHSFSIGQPDNIVFVNELLDKLRTTLANLQCIYCERSFRDTPTLKDHMRKKQHRKINPSNHVYDKYYIINYLEIGKSWQEILAEDDGYIDSTTDDVEESVETKDSQSCMYDSLVCLFCSVTLNSMNKITRHMMDAHNFDFCAIMSQLRNDFYAQVKVINYIRRQVYHKVCIYCQAKYDELPKLICHMTVTHHFQLPAQRLLWDQTQYLFPTYENDGLLCVLNAEDENDI